MKRSIILIIGTLVTRSIYAGPGVLDLTNLENYANQPIPSYITKDNTPGNNPITDLGATLGRVLFYDKRLSRNDTISCASCHQQARAFGDPAVASTGVSGTTGRHSMRLINARFANENRFFWDERAASAEDQATQPIRDHVEMGFSGGNGDPTFADLITKLSAIEEYQVLFTGVFGDAAITEARIQQSLAQFVRSIQSFDSKYDVGRAQVNNNNAPFPNFTAAENAGKTLFMTPPPPPPGGPPPPPVTGAGCAACHQAPEFDISPNSRNNGVIGAIGGGTDTTNTRSPTLRDMLDALGNPHTPFMHNGVFSNTLQVIEHYNAIPPGPIQNLDPRLSGGPGGNSQVLNLTQTEKDNLEAFLKTLTGSNVYTDPKWADPFDDAGALSLIILPADGMTLTMSEDGGVTMATASATGVPNVNYLVQSSTDLVNWDDHPVQATAGGALSLTIPMPPEDTCVYFRYAYIP